MTDTKRKKPAGMSPTKRTLAFLRAAGFVVGITEHWNSFIKQRKDLFGWCDLVAIKEGTTGILGVQTTSGSNHAARRTKILSIPAARLWVACGNRIWVMSWKKTRKWEPWIEQIEIGEFVVEGSE